MTRFRDFSGVIWIGILRVVVGLLAIGTTVEICRVVFAERTPGAENVNVGEVLFLGFRLLILISFIFATNKYREQWELLQAARDFADDRCSLESFGSAAKEILNRS